ncbi:MAG TPA: hypothetical protein VN641_14405 [Urbifossiella sp.]|nr:hypothetical protein [Urbifossiella sp.]
MEFNTMGRVITEATIENIHDVWDAERKLILPDQIRKLDVTDALVEPREHFLSIPTRYIGLLGLNWVAETGMYEPVRLTIMGRSCTMDVMEESNTGSVVIGNIPLTHLDFVVDLRDRKLIGNPAHGGEHVYEMY